jgi:hypothetical protein
MPTSCSYAAPVLLTTPPSTPGEGWVVRLTDDQIDPAGRTALLAQQYGFEVSEVIEGLKMFVADLTLEQMARLRCDTSVLWIQQNTLQNP